MIHYPLVPGQPGQLNIFEARYLVLHERALSTDQLFAIHPSGQRESIGVIARIRMSVNGTHGNIFCNFDCISRCRFLEDSRILENDTMVHKLVYLFTKFCIMTNDIVNQNIDSIGLCSGAAYF